MGILRESDGKKVVFHMTLQLHFRAAYKVAGEAFHIQTE